MACPMNSNTYIKYFLCRKTVTEMLCDRGYDAAEQLVLSRLDFESRFGQRENFNPDALDFRVSHLSDPDDTLQVVFPAHRKSKEGDLRRICEEQVSNDPSLKRLILALVQPTVMKTTESWPIAVEILDGKDLFCNVTRNNEEVRTYKVLSDEENATVEGMELPLMSKAHPIARYYALKEGQIIKITDVRAETDDPERESLLRIN